jgi:hypothetical protein
LINNAAINLNLPVENLSEEGELIQNNGNEYLAINNQKVNINEVTSENLKNGFFYYFLMLRPLNT